MIRKIQFFFYYSVKIVNSIFAEQTKVEAFKSFF